jgi:CheY-like chemotaxis protein
MANGRIGDGGRTSGPLRQSDHIRVMVVDDQDTFRSVLRELIAATAGFVLVGEAASGEDALSQVGELMPDFVIMDARLSGLTGLDTAAALLRRYPEVVILLVSVYQPTQPPIGPAGRTIPFVLKGDLRTSVLREVWEEHKPAAFTG